MVGRKREKSERGWSTWTTRCGVGQTRPAIDTFSVPMHLPSRTLSARVAPCTTPTTMIYPSPCTSPPPSRVPSHIQTHHLLPFVRHPTRLPFAHLRVTTPVSGNSRYKAIHRAYRAVDCRAALFRFSRRRKRAAGDADFGASEDDLSGARTGVSREIFAVKLDVARRYHRKFFKPTIFPLWYYARYRIVQRQWQCLSLSLGSLYCSFFACASLNAAAILGFHSSRPPLTGFWEECTSTSDGIFVPRIKAAEFYCKHATRQICERRLCRLWWRQVHAEEAVKLFNVKLFYIFFQRV